MSGTYVVAAIGLSSIIALAAIISAAGAAMDSSLSAQKAAEIQQKKIRERLTMSVSANTITIKNEGLERTEIEEIRTYSGQEIVASKQFDPVLVIGPLQQMNLGQSDLGSSILGLDIVAITSLGNVFSADHPLNDSQHEGAMISGMGISSRIVTKEFSGKIIYGYGDSGTEGSLKPYNPLVLPHDFAAQVLASDTPITIPITKFNSEYVYNEDLQSLQNVQNAAQNSLGYADVRTVGGTTAVALGSDGITISGNGYAIIRLNDYSSQSLVLEGYVPDGSQLLLSPLEKKNLFTTQYDSSRGFRIFDAAGSSFSTSQTSHSDITCSKGAWGYTNTYSSTYTFSPQLDISTQWGITYGTLSPSASAPIASISGSKMILLSQSGRTLVPSAWCSGTAQPYSYSPAPVTVWDKDPIQWIDYDVEFSSEFQTAHTFSNGPSYLVAKPNGNTITIRGMQFDPASSSYLKITNLPENIPYEILKDGMLAVSGMATEGGILDLLIGELNLSGDAPSGTILLYPDSMRARSPFSTIVMDNVNSEMFHVPTIEDKVYVAHAYLQIPVIGDVTVTEMSLDGSLALPYLDGNYTTGDHILVPIIPGYYNVGMKINGMLAVVRISDVLGGTGVKVVIPTSSTITRYGDSDIVPSISATAGSVSYVVATSSGTLTTSLTATISADSEIENHALFELAPPVPPAPRPKDPLKAWVDVYKNGELYGQKQIYLNSIPESQNSGGTNGLSSFVVDQYAYPQTVISGAVETSVNPGDFVEVYLHAEIAADGSAPPVPSGYVTSRYWGQGHATVTIHGGSMISS